MMARHVWEGVGKGEKGIGEGIRRRGEETEKYETHRQLTHEKKLTH